MNVTYFKTPGGEEMAVLPRAELDALRDAGAIARHENSLADYRAGRLPGLTAEETTSLVSAATPLAFWRGYRALTQAALAAKLGITQGYLSDLETGKRVGPMSLWLRIAAALELPPEAFFDD